MLSLLRSPLFRIPGRRSRRPGCRRPRGTLRRGERARRAAGPPSAGRPCAGARLPRAAPDPSRPPRTKRRGKRPARREGPIPGERRPRLRPRPSRERPRPAPTSTRPRTRPGSAHVEASGAGSEPIQAASPADLDGPAGATATGGSSPARRSGRARSSTVRGPRLTYRVMAIERPRTRQRERSIGNPPVSYHQVGKGSRANRTRPPAPFAFAVSPARGDFRGLPVAPDELFAFRDEGRAGIRRMDGGAYQPW